MQMSTPSSSSPSLLTSIKLKTLIKNFIFSHLNRATRVLTKAKTILVEFVEETRLKDVHIFMKNRNKKKLYIGSFRVHHNLSSSYFVPQSTIHDGFNGYVFYDPKWESFEHEVTPDAELSEYLQWLEDKNSDTLEIVEINEIDSLAENFIANCREKFMLEKQESDRRFQEMMARSL